jgi:5-methylcytosine-specific restriction endonuclease McrA
MSGRNMSSAHVRRVKTKLFKMSSFCPGCWKYFTYEQLTLDHIKPKSLGGSNAITNLRLMCAPCNRERGNDLEWKVSKACRPRW